LFAPSVIVERTQDIFITYFQGKFEISIDDKYLNDWNQKVKLAYDDGFESFEDFSIYYKDKMKDGCFSGKIIHWTDLKY